MAKPQVDELDLHIAKRLKKLRQSLGISAQALGEALDSTQQQMSRYENAHNKLSATQLYRIAQVLGVPVSWFFVNYKGGQQIPRLAEQSPNYEKTQTEEELAAVARCWGRLNQDQRKALLFLIETFLK